MATVVPSSDADHDRWKDYADLLAAGHKAHRAEIRSLIRQLPLAEAGRVLDVPCGDGFYAALFAENLSAGSEVHAVDFDHDALKTAEQQAESLPEQVLLTCHVADIHALPFLDNAFDFVWCAQSLISLSEPSQAPPGQGVWKALDEMHRVLQPGGHIGLLEQDAMHYVLLPWPMELEMALVQAERKGFAQLYGHPDQMHFGRGMGRILGQAGFQFVNRLTLSADHHGVPTSDLRFFLKAYFSELRNRVHRDLKTENLQQFDRLTDPDSGDSFFQDPHFEMTWLEFISLGRKL